MKLVMAPSLLFLPEFHQSELDCQIRRAWAHMKGRTELPRIHIDLSQHTILEGRPILDVLS